MNTSEIVAEVQRIMLDVLDLDELEINERTTAKDVDGWDSLSHIRLVVSIEQAFKIKFSTGEIERFKNIGDMVTTIHTKLTNR